MKSAFFGASTETIISNKELNVIPEDKEVIENTNDPVRCVLAM
jgi:hypothetical protein